MQPYNQQQYWDANVGPPAQQQQQQPLDHYPPPSHQQSAQNPPPPYYYGGDQQQYWNANMWPPAQQQQQLAHHPSPSHHQFAQYPPPTRPPYYGGGSQQQYWNSNMLPPAQQQQQSAQYPPPPRQPHYYGDGAAGNVGGAGDVRSKTLYIGNLEDGMDETFLNSCFEHTRQLVSAKIIRNKQTGQSEGYGFLKFRSRAAAEDIMQSFNGKPMPNAGQSFNLNWASHKAETSDIFVGNLGLAVTDHVLLETFKSEYPSVKSAKVIRDKVTGHSKCCGFVRFGDETERNQSIVQMNGRNISNMPIRIKLVSDETPSSAQPQNASQQNPQGASDPTNTSIYVKGLPFDAPDMEIQQVFSQFGQVDHVYIVRGRRYGFVRFSDRSSAESAVNGRLRNSINIRGKTVRVSWASPRGTGNQQNQPGASQSG